MNITAVFVLLALIGLTLFFSEKMVRMGRMQGLLARKMLHVAGVGGLAVAPVFFYRHHWLTAVALVSGIILWYAVKKRLLAADVYQRESLGIALFPFSFLLLWLAWGKSAPHLVIYPMLILAVADALAAIAGSLTGIGKYNVSGNQKSFSGSVAFALSCFVVTWWVPGWLEPLHPLFRLELPGIISVTDKLALVLVVSLVTAAAEGATSGGWDNVTVPLTAAYLLAVTPLWSGQTLLVAVPLLAMLALLARAAVYKKWLDHGGAMMAWLLGFALWSAGGWPALLLMGVFFVTGSLASGAGAGHAAAADAKLGKPRDYMQVLSNGGVAGLLILAYGIMPMPVFGEMFALSVAISTADTWSSEIGNRAGGRVVDIAGSGPLPAGVSGGISWQGTLAGLAGAFVIAGIAGWQGWGNPLLIGLGGFAGMLADSLMGSLWQAKYRVNETWSDRPPAGQNRVPQKGFAWLTNDRVNLLSNLFVTVLGGIPGYFCG